MPIRIQPVSGGVVPPLAGYCVAVATDRRRHALAGELEERGARTVNVQALRSLAQPDEEALRLATEQVLADDCHEVVVSTGYGLQLWLTAARRWGLADALIARFSTARLLARDVLAADSLRDLGLTTIWSTAAASTEELLRYLAAQPLARRRIVVQTDRSSLGERCAALRRAGADVVEVPTFRTLAPSDASLLRRLTNLIVTHQVDGVALLGEPAASHLLDRARIENRFGDLLNALVDRVLPICLGPLTAAPLEALGIRPAISAAPYIVDLADQVTAELPRRAVRLSSGGCRIEVRGQAVVLDDQLIPLPAGPIAVLRTLAEQPGQVLSCGEIRRAIPHWSEVDDHAIEMAVSRLRRGLKRPDLVQTIMRRGYRLAS